MNAPPPPGHRRPYWMVAAFVALMLLPATAATPAAFAILAAALAIRGGRVLARLRTNAASVKGDALVLGTTTSGGRALLERRQLAAHGLILGASGAGKSTTMLTILCDHVARGLPVVAIDLKGSPAFTRRLGDAAARAGRPFLAWTPDGPARWNPLAHGNATELKDKLIATERFTEPHYQRAAERYVQTVLQVLGELHPGRPPTLDEVVALNDPHRLAAAARNLPAPMRERVNEYLAGLTPDQMSAIRGLGTRLAVITESHTGRFLSPAGAEHADGDSGLRRGHSRPRSPAGAEHDGDSKSDPLSPGDIDLRRALDGDGVVLFSLNSSSYGKLAAQLGTLAVQDLISAAGDRLKQSEGTQSQALVAIDEFSALGADHVISLLARGREAGVSVLVATQELADLDRAAPGARDQILGNTAIKIVHRQDVPGSAQTVAQMAGTERVWEETRQFGGSPLSSYPGSRGTRRLAEQFRVHPNVIKTLQTGEAVVITKLPRADVHTVRVSPPSLGVPGPASAPSPPVHRQASAPAHETRFEQTVTSALSTSRSARRAPDGRRAPADDQAPARRDRPGPEQRLPGRGRRDQRTARRGRPGGDQSPARPRANGGEQPPPSRNGPELS